MNKKIIATREEISQAVLKAGKTILENDNIIEESTWLDAGADSIDMVEINMETEDILGFTVKNEEAFFAETVQKTIDLLVKDHVE